MKRCLFFFLGLLAAILLAMVSEPEGREQQMADNVVDNAELHDPVDASLVTEAARPDTGIINRKNK